MWEAQLIKSGPHSTRNVQRTTFRRPVARNGNTGKEVHTTD